MFRSGVCPGKSSPPIEQTLKLHGQHHQSLHHEEQAGTTSDMCVVQDSEKCFFN